MKVTRFFLLLCLLLSPVLLQAQQPDDSIARLLASGGFENIRLLRRNDTLFVGLENRVWRWEVRGAAEALKRMMPGVDSHAVVSLTLHRNGIPVTTLVVSRRQYDNLLAGRMKISQFADSVVTLLSDRGYRNTIGRLHSINRSFHKADVVVFPQLKVQFGNFLHPLEFQFNIAPVVQVNILKGMTLTAQAIFPVYSNILGDPQGNTIRPGLVVLSQSFRLPHQFYATASAGYFTNDRYGLSGKVHKFLFNGRLAIGATAGYTGRVQLIGGAFNYTSMHVPTWFCDASYRVAIWDLTLGAGYGSFIDRDRGWRADVTRQFGEVSIGFFAMKSGSVVNGGFNFIVPLPLRRHGTKNRIRVRPAPYVPWEYRAKGLPNYGRTFSTGNVSEEMMFEMNPDYIRRGLGAVLREVTNDK